MFCLSKGLCAPAGSLLAGPKDFIQEARMRRKLLGGGMRQAGILAAAGIIALKDFPNRLVEDHRRARYIAGHLAAIPGVVITPEEQNINMVFFSYPPAQDQAAAQKIQEVFAQNSIRINAPQDGRYRFVTHYWIGDREAGLVVKAAQEAFAP
jgi:threonine aldolase